MDAFNWEAESEKKWNELAESWNSRSREMWESGSRKDIVPFLKGFLSEGSYVCDLGCGDGAGTGQLAEAGYLVTGIDVSDEMLDKARQEVPDERAIFRKANLSDCGSPDSYFHGIMAINSLEWTRSPYESLKEMKRILKPGGFACIGILGPTAGPRNNSYRRLYGEEVICNTIMPWELERLAVENGWEKAGEYGVYKMAAKQLSLGSLPIELQQALSFMWVFMFQLKNKGGDMDEPLYNR